MCIYIYESRQPWWLGDPQLFLSHHHRIAAKMAMEASERARHAASSSPERVGTDGDAGGALATDELFRALRWRGAGRIFFGTNM